MLKIGHRRRPFAIRALVALVVLGSVIQAGAQERRQPDASAGQGTPGLVQENPGAHPRGHDRSGTGPPPDPGNTRMESGNTRYYSPRGTARPGDTLSSGTDDQSETDTRGGSKQRGQ